MPTARARHLWMLLLAPAAVMAVAWWQHAGPHAAGSVAGLALPLGGAAPVQAEPLSPRAIAVGPGLPLDRRAGLERQPDLYRYAQQLGGEVQAGDAEASWLLSRVYDYCAGYALDPGGYAADSQWIAAQSGDGVATMAAARNVVAQRCAGFTAQDGLSPQAVLAKRIAAARAGNLAAEASLLALGQPLEAGEGYRHQLVQRVLDSRDPEAYLALAPAMGARASGDDALRGYVAGDQFAELAWQMAACRLGLDCDAQSTLMTSYCANGGICSQDAGQDFESFVYDAAVSRQGFGKMDEMVTALVDGSGVKS
jgi:hypothetical protein